MPEEYIVFTDESSTTKYRYPSICAFSIPYKFYELFCERYGDILKNCNIEKEFKWQKIRSSNYYNCGKLMVDLVTNNIFEYEIRVDVITWDTHDSRHTVKGRDDTSNFERMFYHLLYASMKKRDRDSIWHIRPDEKGDVDWKKVHECLSCAGKRREFEHTLWGTFFADPYFKVVSFEEQKSEEEILIQFADLFSGMASFSRNFETYLRWKRQVKESIQPSLFDNYFDDKEESLSNMDKSACALLDYFHIRCKENKMRVSLNENGYLVSYRPNYPINFWPYQPQGDYDKAPTKK